MNKHIVDSQPMTAATGVAGYYRLVLEEKDGTVVQDTGWFKNLITNNGLLFIRDELVWFGNVMLGSGSAAPTILDTTVTTPIDGVKKDYTGQVSAATSDYFFSRGEATFLEGVSTGNVRELANFTPAQPTKCFNHSLILDAGSNPTTIVKGPDQILRVFYEIRNYPKLTDTVGVIDISGTSYDYTVRAANFAPGISSWNVNVREEIVFSSEQTAFSGGDLGPTTGQPTGTSIGSLSGSPGAIAKIGSGSFGPPENLTFFNDYQLQASTTWWVHANGIRCVIFRSRNCIWQIKYAATVGGGSIPKTAEQRLRLKFRLSWTRF